MKGNYRELIKIDPVFRVFPHWVFEPKAVSEMLDYIGTIPTDTDYLNELAEKHPLPNIVLEVIDDIGHGDPITFTMGAINRGHPKFDAVSQRCSGGAQNVAVILTCTEDDMTKWQVILEKDREKAPRDLARIGHWFYALRQENAERIVNKAVHPRTGAHRPPSLAPRDITYLTIDWKAPTLRYTQAAHNATGTRGPVCEHDVKPFKRKLRDGRVVDVKGHKRGDPNVPRKTVVRIV